MTETGKSKTALVQSSRYFQSIARAFFEQRGAPFFLSAKELDVVAEWEKRRIPLHVVREGINRAFERQRMKRGPKEKILSLLFCNRQVLEAFQVYLERRVGRNRGAEGHGAQKKRMEADLDRFLLHIPEHLGALRPLYREAKRKLMRRPLDEEGLERLEEEAETLILEAASAEERTRVLENVGEDYPGAGTEERDRIFRIKLIRHLRLKHRIPPLSLLYY